MSLDETLTTTATVEPPTADLLARGRETLTAHTHAEITRHAALARRRTRRRVVIGGIGLAAAATGAFLVVPRDDVSPAPFSATAPVVEADYRTASEVLADAAAAAGQQPGLGDAPYWEVVTQQGADESTRRTFWIGIDGPGSATIPDSPIGDRLMELPAAQFVLDGRTYTWRDINAGALPLADLPRLLTERELAKGPSAKTDRAPLEHYVFKEAFTVLGMSPASPEVRAALWTYLSEMPGVVLDGEVTDALGREGWSVSLTTPGWGTQRYVVDPATGAILEAAGDVIVEAGPADFAPRPGRMP